MKMQHKNRRAWSFNQWSGWRLQMSNPRDIQFIINIKQIKTENLLTSEPRNKDLLLVSTFLLLLSQQCKSHRDDVRDVHLQRVWFTFQSARGQKDKPSDVVWCESRRKRFRDRVSWSVCDEVHGCRVRAAFVYLLKTLMELWHQI